MFPEWRKGWNNIVLYRKIVNGSLYHSRSSWQIVVVWVKWLSYINKLCKCWVWEEKRQWTNKDERNNNFFKEGYWIQRNQTPAGISFHILLAPNEINIFQELKRRRMSSLISSDEIVFQCILMKYSFLQSENKWKLLYSLIYNSQL